VPGMGHSPLDRFTRIKHPVAREEDLLVEHLADETVIYDTRTKEAHCLSPLSAAVFAHCDGRTTVDQLAALATERLDEPVDGPRVMDALAQLQERDLLAVPPRDGLSRRDMLRRTAMAGAAAASIPLITTIVAPTPAAAQTQFCSNLCDCCEPGCVNNDPEGGTDICNPGGNNCCYGLACSCTGEGLGETGKHCKPGQTGAINCAGFPCGSPPACN
jgi:Coenzyme PQQ synthesis protein D (PqqD)